MRTISKAKTELDIRRPDGTTETVDVTQKFYHLTDPLFHKIQAATRNAGKGEVLRYRNIAAITETEESDYHQPCIRCKKDVDTRTAYMQMEWRRFGGTKIKVRVPYCSTCHSLLSSIGQGEITDLEHRAGNIPSYESEYKGD